MGWLVGYAHLSMRGIWVKNANNAVKTFIKFHSFIRLFIHSFIISLISPLFICPFIYSLILFIHIHRYSAWTCKIDLILPFFAFYARYGAQNCILPSVYHIFLHEINSILLNLTKINLKGTHKLVFLLEAYKIA